MEQYTKVSNELVAKFGIKLAYVYAKLCYRMKLSIKTYGIGNKYFYKNGFFIIYKVNDLAKDTNIGRGTIIRILKKLEKYGLVYKDRTMYSNHLYLPKFNSHVANSYHKTNDSSKKRLSKEQRSNNKDSNKYGYSSSCSPVKEVKRNHKNKFPKYSQMIKRFGKQLVNYSIKIYHQELDKNNHIHNAMHFIYGILRRWQRKGIKTVNDAMISEHDCHAVRYPNGPRIPIFDITEA